jgi:hypothetical protein
MRSNRISRCDFLKVVRTAGLGAAAFSPLERVLAFPTNQSGKRLGRVSVAPFFNSTELRAIPSRDAASVGTLGEDTIVQWLPEVIGSEHYGVSRT